MPRNYKSEYANYHSKPEQKKKRAQRNKARREMEKAGKVRKGDGKDVNHKVPLAKAEAIIGLTYPSLLEVRTEVLREPKTLA